MLCFTSSGKKSVHISLKVQIRAISRKSVSSPQISNPRLMSTDLMVSVLVRVVARALTQVGSFEKGSTKILFSEMQVGSMKAAGSQYVREM